MMIDKKYIPLIGMLGIVLSPTLVIFPSFTSETRAQLSPQFEVSVTFPPASDRGAPPRSRGAGTRGPGCGNNMMDTGTSLTALMPENNVATTVSPNPTVYLYVPKRIEKEAEFVVFDLTNRKIIYDTTFALDRTDGIVKVTLPETIELKSGNDYLWHFGIICNPNDPSQNEVVQGAIERVSLSVDQEAQIEKAQPLDRAKFYAEAGVWNEAIAIVAQMRDSHPAEWAELLDSVGLGEMTEKTILECCTFEK